MKTSTHQGFAGRLAGSLRHPRQTQGPAIDPPPAPPNPPPAGDPNAPGFNAQQQEHVNRLLARERRALEEKLTAEQQERQRMQEEMTGMRTELQSVQAIIRSAEEEVRGNGSGTPGTGDPVLDDYERTLIVPKGVKDPEAFRQASRSMFLLRRQIDTLVRSGKEQGEATAALRKELDEARTAQRAASNEAERARKDTALISALNQNGCIDLEVGVRILRDQVVERDGRLLFRQKDGTEVSLASGVSAELPTYMRKPAADHGGSGAGGTGHVVTDQQLVVLRGRLAEAEKRARATGGDSAIAEMQRLKRDIATAEAQRRQ